MLFFFFLWIGDPRDLQYPLRRPRQNCIRDRILEKIINGVSDLKFMNGDTFNYLKENIYITRSGSALYTHPRPKETELDSVCRFLLEKKKQT